MSKLSILIPARQEEFLQQTIDDIFKHAEGDIEVLVGLDGWYADIPQRNNLKVFYYSESKGQRGCMNALARQAEGNYLMKCDAHMSFSQGFDMELLKLKEEATVILPALCNLHVYNWICDKGHRKNGEQFEKVSVCEQCGGELKKELVWKPIPKPVMTNYYFDTNLHFQYCEEQDDEHEITETMSTQGACFMVSKKDYWDLELCDEKFGSWGQQGTEISCKVWLSGGRIISTRNAFNAHWFRVFPYKNPVEKILETQKYSRDLFLNDKWEKQIYPLIWLVDKFGYPGDWKGSDVLEKIKNNKRFKWKN